MPTLSAHAVQRVVTTGQTRTEVLQCCDLELRGTGLTAVVGHSGSGKSSFLMCLSGLDKPTSGTVALNGRDIYRQSRAQRARMLRQEIGFVFQQYNLVPFLSVEENISLPFRLNHVAIPRDAIDQLIDAFGLGRRRKAPARTFSGGEQQRTALCRQGVGVVVGVLVGVRRGSWGDDGCVLRTLSSSGAAPLCHLPLSTLLGASRA